MTSEIRANTLKNRVGLGTIEYSNTGPVISGVTTAFNFKTGTSNLHNTGLNIFDLEVDGHANLDNVSISGVTTTSHIHLTDNNEIRLGTGSGGDTKIVHVAGSHTEINHIGSGDLVLETINGGDDILLNSNDDIFLQHQGEMMVECRSDDGVKLYFDNSEKIATISNGVQITGTVDVNGGGITLEDTAHIELGNSADLLLKHDGSNSYILNSTGFLNIKTTGGGAHYIDADDQYFRTAGGENLVKMIGDGAVELYFDNSRKFKTDSIGCEITGALIIPDGSHTDNRISIGNAGDLKIFHGATGISTMMHYHSGGEPLHITSNGDVKFKVNTNSLGANGEDGLTIRSNGAVQLYHDGSLRAYTVSNALNVEQAQHNDDCSILINNKFASLSNNQTTTLVCRVERDAGGSHGGGNRQAKFGHNYNSSTGGGGFFNIRSNDGTNRDFYMDNSTNLRVNYGNSNIGTTNGTVVGSQSSDIRNKNLVGDGTVSYGLSEILQLNPIKYQYKKELVDRIGFSAQQVEPIIPESVYDTGQDQDNEGNAISGDTIKAMYYVDLIPVLVNGIKELKAENDALKKRLDDAGL